MTPTVGGQLVTGSYAPGFSLPSTTGSMFTLSEHLGKHVIVYFFPAAMSPGCTTEALDFQDSLDALTPRGYLVVGVSMDPLEKLKRFAAQEKLPFPLLSDTTGAVARSYGAYGQTVSFGNKSRGIIRSTVVVGQEGRVEHAAYNVRATGHVAKLRRDLGLA
ncbi:MAG: peroxiredoxin [Micrococcales bacterium]|nr:MAG: peroxiredoxin [Micrococcales bacterium]PIE27084.1 MAG: peroxiredoxin [Micrococcales bacterium]